MKRRRELASIYLDGLVFFATVISQFLSGAKL
jgi:hypothetical protein